jgi:4-amino-4-deoxy-L-arabinose transferase-like glycosyltransferase
LSKVSKQRERAAKSHQAPAVARKSLPLKRPKVDAAGLSPSFGIRWSPTQCCVLLTAATLVCLVPFSGRAFHVDDTLFIRAAQNIARHPLDPYGFQINWDGAPQAMADVTQNPPLASYYAALIGRVFGWSEQALHLGFLVMTVLLVVGIWRLARRFTGLPMLAALASLLAPGLLVSACSVMCDTMMLTIWVWATILWLEGLERPRHGFLAGAAFLTGLAALTKYFGISLLPLLAAYSLLRLRRLGTWLFYFLIPVAMLIWYQLWTERLYGHGLLLGAAEFSATERAYAAAPWLTMLIVGLSFAGGCALMSLTFAPILWSRSVCIAAVAGGALATMALAKGWLGTGLQVGATYLNRRNWFWVDSELTVFIAAGILLLWLVVKEFDYRNAGSCFLVLWLAGTLVFASLVNYTVNVRSVLPLIPPASILLVRRLEKTNSGNMRRRLAGIAMALALSGMISLIVAAGDTAMANSARQAAAMAIENTAGHTGTVWFEGHWGFQYYMERAGARPLDMTQPEARTGDLLVIPENNYNVRSISPDLIATQRDFQVQPRGWASTVDTGHRAGFYSSYWGQLPYYLGLPPAEGYVIVQLATLRPGQR